MSEAGNPDATAMNRLGTLYKAGRLAELESESRKLIADFPEAPVLYEILGAALAGQNKLEEAAESCRALLALQPGNAGAHSNLGFALRQLGRLEDSVEACRQSVKLDPKYVEGHNNLGVALQALGRAEDAVASFRQAVKLAPGFAMAYNNLASALRDCGRLGEAVTSYRRALEIAPNQARIHSNLGIALHELGKTQEALASCARAVEIDPDSAENWNNLGITQRDAGDLEAAVASYRKAVALDDKNAEAHNNLGNTLNDLGRTDDAMASYRRVLELRPAHPLAGHMLAALSGENTRTAPREYVTRLFDDYAKRFDAHLTGALNYDTPARLVALLKETLPERKQFARAADLGCGTGLSGVAFRPVAGWLTGIDLSREMIAEAKSKRAYDKLITGGIAEVLGELDEMFDLFICTDVLIYAGDADEILAAAAARATDDAVFCVSTEEFDGDGYTLRPTGRYAHSDAYMESAAAAHGFRLAAKADAMIRKEKTGPIPGRHFVFMRGPG